MKRILITSTDVMMAQFIIPHIDYLCSEGYVVDVACSKVQGFDKEVEIRLRGKAKVEFVELERSPFSIKNIRGLKQLRRIISKVRYDLIWTNEPVMGTMTRLAAIGARAKVIYFAHGFHFYKGASIKRWLIIYPIEKIMARFTDCLITINNEDYQRAKKSFHKKLTIYQLPGIGIDTSKFRKKGINTTLKRKEINIGDNAIVILSVGELEKRKNHELSIEAFEKLHLENAYLVICGIGTQQEKIEKKIRVSKVKDRIKLLGYRTDISELCEMSDLFLFSSFQEGLSVALMEAMSNELVCVVSRIRGNVDLISPDRGFLFSPYSIDECSSAIIKALESKSSWTQMSKKNQEYIKKYDIWNVEKQMKEIIDSMIGEEK